VSNTVGRVEDKRLSIDSASLRQDLWKYRGTEVDKLDIHRFDDWIKWVDTSGMVIDCLTKAMSADALVEALKSGFLDYSATPLSTAQKIRKRAQRRSKKDSDKKISLDMKKAEDDDVT